MSHAGPWSPFPVQDWSSLPADPLSTRDLAVDDPNAHVDPSWAPPQPYRWWPPLIVLLVIGTLIGTGAYVSSAVGLSPPGTAATRFLPADGSATYEQVEIRREQQTSAGVQVTESARFTGYTGVLSTDGAFGNRLLGGVDDPAALLSWRTVSTPVGAPAGAATSAQTTRFYRVNSAVELLGESGPTAAYTYRPALVELPADVHPGASWTGTGVAGADQTYRSQFRAAAAPEDCLLVTGEVRYLTGGVPPGRVVNREQTWCPGRGVVTEFTSSGSTTARTSAVAPPAPGPVNTAPAALVWTDPEQWSGHALTTISTDPTLGEESMSGSPQTLLPVRTDSGLVVRAVSSMNDLVATTPRNPDRWTSVWRVHVPGSVLTLRAFGGVLLVTTSERTLLAYSDAGVRLWQLGLGELAPTPPVRVSDDTAVLTDLSGTVRAFSIDTGRLGWQHSVGSDVNVAPAVGAGLVVVMDRGGTTTALDAGTGNTRWTTQLEGSAAGFVAGTLVVLQDQTAHGLDPATGRGRWLRPFEGTVTDLVPFGDQLVLATKNASVLLDGSGRVTARLDPYLAVTVVQGHLLGWGTSEAQLVDGAGRVTGHWPLPGLTLANQDRLVVALPQSVLLFNLDWTFQEWRHDG